MNFEDIFSKSGVKKSDPCPNPNNPILVDTRESQSLIVANLHTYNVNYEFEKLEIGDYLIQDTKIERKTFSDFLSSIVNKRLQEQLISLKKYKKQILLLEGFDYDYKKFNVHENAIKGMILSIAIDFQIPIIFSKDSEDTAKFLTLTAKRSKSQKKMASLRLSKDFKNSEEQKLFILEGFPGIGPTTAYNLLKKFKSLKNIFKASKKKLGEMGSLDDKTIDKFKKLLED